MSPVYKHGAFIKLPLLPLKRRNCPCLFCLCPSELEYLSSFAATGHTAAWVLFAVSQDSDVEAGIVKELHGLDLLASPQCPVPRSIEWDDIPKLTYLTATIKVFLLSLHQHACEIQEQPATNML